MTGSGAPRRLMTDIVGDAIGRPNEVAGAFLHRIVRFGQALRAEGIPADPTRVQTLATTLGFIDLGRRDDLYFAARTSLLSRPDQRDTFDRLFARFFPPLRRKSVEPPADAGSSDSDGVPGAPDAEHAAEVEGEDDDRSPTPGAAAFVFELDEPPDASQSDDGSAPPALASYSSSETLRTRDFSHLTDAEIAVLRRLMARLRTRSAQRLTRRMRPSPRGATLDLRRTIRRSLTTGGEPLTFARRELKVRPRPIVLLCDVSGSMERYTRLLLQFLHTVSHGTGATVETFAYATRLTRITPALKRRRVEDALTRVHEDVQDLHGGTRTGEALASFNRNWARRVLGRGAIVLIISDGWDRGDPVQLGREMARLQRTSFRLFWLNPLLGSPSYKPLTRGMQAALPYLDDFLPSHSLESLHDLVALLSELPLRRSGPVPAHARRRPRSPFLPAMVRPR